MTTKTTKKRPLRSPRKAIAKAPQTDRGNLSKPEITKLLMQAQEAYQYQAALRHIEPGDTFDSWRRDQVMDAVGLPGISKISRSHFRQVFAHFLTLSGRDEEAFQTLMETGPKRDHGPAGDTHESSEAIVHHIREALANHASAVLPSGQDHLHAGWLLAAARQRTRKPTLTLDTLAERLDPRTLVGLLSHLRNHISRREGREKLAFRSARIYPKSQESGDPF